MKAIFFAFALISSTQAFAAAQLVCLSEDGSQVQATFSNTNELSQIRIQLRDGKLQAVEGARAALLDIKNDQINSMVITSANGRILVAVASGVYVDRTGAYSVDQCEVSY